MLRKSLQYNLIERNAKMNDLRPPHDPIDALGQSYELLLEKALEKAHQSGTVVDH